MFAIDRDCAAQALVYETFRRVAIRVFFAKLLYFQHWMMFKKTPDFRCFVI